MDAGGLGPQGTVVPEVPRYSAFLFSKPAAKRLQRLQSEIDDPRHNYTLMEELEAGLAGLQSSRGRWWVAGASTSAGRLPRDCPVPKLEVPRIQHALPQLGRCLSSTEPLGPHVLRQHLGRHPFPSPHGVEVRELG
jgi:hypothetical protein